MTEQKIFYLCDRKKCENCSYPVCKQTQDITHALNFKCEEGIFKEIEKAIIVKVNNDNINVEIELKEV